ncbi:MAG: zinc-dependent peptidase [Rubripirellula sp.]|nr:zinc-dependent peptidase [Rubripirellula sp.]
MLVTEQSNRSNQRHSLVFSVVVAVVILLLALKWQLALFALPLAYGVYHLMRRRTLRRIKVLAEPLPDTWEEVLLKNVVFYQALDEAGRERFRNLVKVFIDEVPVTGIRTDVDDITHVLVAASATIPIFGFEDWEYSGLGEILIYPGAFNEEYQTDQGVSRNTLGMIGVNHLSGVMILSKPDLISGFKNHKDKRNVGIHEFAHLVDKADGAVDGLPNRVAGDVAAPWIGWVAEELKRDPRAREEIDDYAYTNEAEYFAVLSEYFFEAPEHLQRRHPEVYGMMRKMYHQDTRSFLSRVKPRARRVGRNSPCPCGSSKKYKKCCSQKTKRGMKLNA